MKLPIALMSVLVSALLASSSVSAAVDADASVVLVRANKSNGSSGCVENSVALNNCFASPGAAATWIMNTRKPTAANPLVVEIGPGSYGGFTFTCDPSWGGHTTFRGAGADQTIIGNLGVTSCTSLNFFDLMIKGGSYGAIQWDGGGKSSWHNVRVEGPGQAWYSNACGSSRGSHYWFGSRIANTAAAFGIANAYFERCDESWFFGSELSATVQAGAYPANGGAVNATEQGIIHVYGSVLRVFINGSTDALGVAGALVGGYTSGGEIHIHGTGIDVTSTTGANIVALNASNGGMIHADVSAYNMITSGTVTRIKKDTNSATHVHAPYTWQHIPTNPLISVTGADYTTETIGADTNLLVYNSLCTGSGGPWYNVALRACR